MPGNLTPAEIAELVRRIDKARSEGVPVNEINAWLLEHKGVSREQLLPVRPTAVWKRTQEIMEGRP